MGFIPPLIAAATTAATAAAPAAGATAAGAAGAAAGTTALASVPFDAALAGETVGASGAAASAAGGAGAAAAGGASAGLKALAGAAIKTGAQVAGTGLIAQALRPPKFPKPPSPPDFSTFLKPGSAALIGGNEGSFGGTFLGNNRSPQISGGKKTLGGA